MTEVEKKFVEDNGTVLERLSALNSSQQQESYKAGVRMRLREEALRFAEREKAFDGRRKDQLLDRAQEIYEWLIKDL